MSRTNQASGRSCTGELGCDWIAENRSVPLPKPYDVVRFSDLARLFRQAVSSTLGHPA
jgi:hypothetical protein